MRNNAKKIVVYENRFREADGVNELKEAFSFRNLEHRLSEFVFSDVHADLQEWENAIDRAISVCKTSGLPVDANFKCIYIAGDTGMARDWLLSSLARKLVLLNASPTNSKAAQLQLEIARRLEAMD